MFRASDIFGRRPGAVVHKPQVKAEEMPAAAAAPSHGGPTSRAWDPATGEWVEEELPAEVLEMMGRKPAPAVKKELKREAPDGGAWKQAPLKAPRVEAAQAAVNTDAPSVEFSGFSKVELNSRYYESTGDVIHGHPTYWDVAGNYFCYWQGEVRRWAICDTQSFPAVRAGQYPGWAYRVDDKFLSIADGWEEAWGGEWRKPELEVAFRSSSNHKPQWEHAPDQKNCKVIEIHGFSMKELNTRYFEKPGQLIQGKPSYWDNTGVYFIYWQQVMDRWAICDLKCLDAVQSGQNPGWAYRGDAGFLANANGWMEARLGVWTIATVETAVISTSCKGLKVAFEGFSKKDLNTEYVEKREEVIQGRPSFWDAQGSYFIYWQASMTRWAICDRLSLSAAKEGKVPGWAYRTDSGPFFKSSSIWMEAYGRDWRETHVKVNVIEGTALQQELMASGGVKEEVGDGPKYEADQYVQLITKVYEEKNPSKLYDVTRLLDKYQGREHKLYAEICKKYAVSMDEFAGQHVEGAEPAPKVDDEGEAGDVGVDIEAEFNALSASDWAERIQMIYVSHNPSKLADLGMLLRKYRNREGELYMEVCQKYRVDPAKFHAQFCQEQQGADAPTGNTQWRVKRQ